MIFFLLCVTMFTLNTEGEVIIISRVHCRTEKKSLKKLKLKVITQLLISYANKKQAFVQQTMNLYKR
jgi:hypothetical protein